jgi:hypothetical protein
MADLSKPGNKDNDSVMVDFLPANDAVTKGNPKRKTNDANVRKQAQAGQEVSMTVLDISNPRAPI